MTESNYVCKQCGANMAISGLTVTSLISDPQYSLFMKLVDDGIRHLCGMSFERE